MKTTRVFARLGIFLCLLAAALAGRAQQLYTNLHTFTNSPDGATPVGLVTDGTTLWGASQSGGSATAGTIFTLATNGGNFGIVYNFGASGNDGSLPGELLLNGGTLFGMTQFGGTNNSGTIYSIGTNGANYTVLRSFTNAPDAANPYIFAGLTLGGATLYGTSQNGGTNGRGTVFKIDTNGNNYAVLHHFGTNADGATPQGRLLLLGATLYGTTQAGGSNSVGTVFKLDTNGNNYSVLYHFSNSPAANLPVVGLTSDGAGLLFGVSSGGGISNAGTVFSIATNGNNFTLLHSFTNSDGRAPQGTLVFKNGMLFGNTLIRGAGGGGTVFELATNGANFTVLYNFTNALNGANHQGSMVWLNNSLYGVAGALGPGGGGTVFGMQLAPFISAQPQPSALTVTNGNAASFSGGGGGLGNLNYQWLLNGTPVAGANSATLNYASVTTNQAGSYTLAVSNLNGSVTSSPAVLTVLDAPWITAPPQSELVTNGNPANFSVTAVNGTLFYQWYLNTNTLLAGQTGSTFNIAAVTTNDAGAYTVVVSNNIGVATSAPAILTVSLNTKPTITAQPTNQTIVISNNVNFVVNAFGLAPLQYQWYSNTVATALGTALAGKTNSTLSYTNVGTNFNSRYFTVVLTNTLGRATSNPALLTVVAAPLIVTNPQAATVGLSNTAAFSVAALGPNLRYQWYSNSVNTALGTALAAQTNSTYSLTALTNQNNRYFSVVITNNFGRATSSPPALLTVVLAPLILTNPQPATVNYGGSANFTLAATGANPLFYQWYFNTNTLLPNQTNAALALTNIDNTLAGFYSAIVTNVYGRATSSPALLAVNGSVPVIVLQPLGVTAAIGSFVTFTSTATGALGYQWFFNTNTIISGANNTNLAIAGANQPGYYAMVATNNFGAATSSPALLNLTGTAKLLASAFDAASGSFSFNYLNLAGSTNRLWATTNLANANAWRVLATNIMATNGAWNFTDTNTAKTNAVRLYRFSTP